MEGKNLALNERSHYQAAGFPDHDGMLKEGLRFIDTLAMKLKMQHLETTVDLYALIDLLIARGIINSREFNQRRELIRPSLEEEFARDPLQVMMEPTPDKYTLEPSLIDCRERYQLCRARCCTLSVPLSHQDLNEGVVRCNYGMPFTLAVTQEGYCVHFDQERGKCSIYEQRPTVCRTYDCRNDTRIWNDFDARIPAS